MNALQFPGAASFGFFADLLLLVQPGHVVVRHLLESVERHDVIHIEIDAMGLHSVRDPLQFLLIFGIDVRPSI